MSKEFLKVVESNKGTLMIVDALNLAFRWKHAKSTNFVQDYIKVVDSLKKSYKADKVIIVADSGSSSYRLALYPEYKANRKEKYANQTEQEYQEFIDFLEEFKRTLDAINEIYPVIKFNGVEADDLAAYIVKSKDKYNLEEIWLISSDKDWDLLIGNGISRFSYITRKEITVGNWKSHYDYAPEDHISIKCIQGDSGDNIKGVEGIGPKRALDLIKQFGSALDIVECLPLDSKYKFIQNLNNSGDLIHKNFQLMDLLTYCEEAIGNDNIKQLDKQLDEYLK